MFADINCSINTLMIEYTEDIIKDDKVEDNLDDYVEMGCYVLFVSEQDGQRFCRNHKFNIYT